MDSSYYQNMIGQLQQAAQAGMMSGNEDVGKMGPNIYDAINKARAANVDQEVNALNNPAPVAVPTGGGRSGGGGVSNQAWGYAADMSDPIGQIVARIGQLRGEQQFNGQPGHGGAYDESLNDEATPLEQYLREYYKKQDDQDALTRAQTGAANRSNQPQDMKLYDPYAQARQNTISAASNYLSQKNPFLVSNL